MAASGGSKTAVGLAGPATRLNAVCQRCGEHLSSAAYEIGDGEEMSRLCLRCALLSPRLVARSLLICLLVGTLLVAINQGNVILQGEGSLALAWKIPLTYTVPYCVATAGAILNSRAKPPLG